MTEISPAREVEEPLPCPFCGSTEFILFVEASTYASYAAGKMLCRAVCYNPVHNGGIEGPAAYTASLFIDRDVHNSDAIAAWNRRSPPTPAKQKGPQPMTQTPYEEARMKSDVIEAMRIAIEDSLSPVAHIPGNVAIAYKAAEAGFAAGIKALSPPEPTEPTEPVAPWEGDSCPSECERGHIYNGPTCPACPMIEEPASPVPTEPTEEEVARAIWGTRLPKNDRLLPSDLEAARRVQQLYRSRRDGR